MAEPRIPKELARKQLKINSSYHGVFKTPEGKKVLNDLFLSHYMLTSTYVPNDQLATAINEGERRVVLRILTILQVTPQELAKRIEDANSDEEY